MALNTEALNKSEFARPVNRVALFDGFDYALTAISRLTNQFFDSTKLQAMLFQAIDPYTQLEIDANDLQEKRWVDLAEGRQLDGVGYIVGEPRLGRDDEPYREAIRFKIFVNTSNATPEDLIKALKFLTRPDDWQYMESYPATAMLFTDGPRPPKNIRATIQNISPAAIADVPVMVSFAGVKPFRFGNDRQLGELFVQNDANYLTGNGADIQVAVSGGNDDISRFGGLVPAHFELNGLELALEGFGGVTFLAINSPEYMGMLESGHHLTGVL